MANYLVDLKYDSSERDWTKDTSNDLVVVGDVEAIAQACILRLLIKKGRYMFNTSLGSDLYRLLEGKVVGDIENRARTMVEAALRPEIENGNLESVDDVITGVNADDATKLEVRILATIRSESIDIGVTI